MMMEMNKVENKGEVVVDVEDDDVVLPGFRFHPTDEELIGFYLRRKIEKKALSIEIIKEIDIYKYDPWDLPKSVTLGAKEWYFFCLRGRKYKNSIRPNRVTGSGFWKATGIDRPIYSSSESSTSSECIGLKKSLVYYRGAAGKGTKTEWMMHEFRLPSSTKTNNIQPASMQEAEVWTICRIFKRNLSDRKCQQNSLRQAVSKQQLATESSSKTSSFCSEVVNDYNNNKPVVSKYEGGVELRFSSNCYYDDNISHNNYDGQSWNNNSVVQTPASVAIESTNPVPNHANNEIFKDGTTNWDELGRIMDFMMSDQPCTWV